MLEPDILTPEVLHWDELTQYWYQWVLFGLIIASVATGIIYIIFSIVIRIIRYHKSRPKKDVLSRHAIKHLKSLVPACLQRPRLTINKPASYSIYLGDFTCPPRPAQLDLLKRSDLTILDPLAPNAKHIVLEFGNRQYLGRLNLEQVLGGITGADARLERFCDVVLTTFTESAFRGILIAGLEDSFSTAYVKAILDFVGNAGLVVYIEVKGPKFLKDTSLVSHSTVTGLVVRNAVVLADGQHRDYFDMLDMQTTVRAFVRESCLRSFTVLALEVHDNNVTVSNAVLKRGIQWCGFYSAMTWTGPQIALVDANANKAAVEPMGAFEWLKDEKIMKIHGEWRANKSLGNTRNENTEKAWQQVSRFSPETANLLASSEKYQNNASGKGSLSSIDRLSVPSMVSVSNPAMADAFHEYQALGCYPLGSDVSPLAFAEVVQAQIRLQGLKLLHPVDKQKVIAMGILFNKFLNQYLITAYPESLELHNAMRELSKMVQSNKIAIHIGLNPGFKYGAHARFWGVYRLEDESRDIYISKDAQGIAGTVLHTFLSSKGFPRDKCLEMETVLAVWSNDAVEPFGLPRRLIQDVDLLTPQERLMLLQQLKVVNSETHIMTKIQHFVRESLVEGPSHNQLGEMDSVGYLNGTVSVRALLEARFAWYDELRIRRPAIGIAQKFFTSLEEAMVGYLRGRHDKDLAKLSAALEVLLVPQTMDAWADLLGLATFCAARKAAFDEIYLEVTDRNPLFNDQTDQAAAFAESFALGSRCEVYFDVSPSVFGKLLSDRFRAHYNDKQPPSWINGAPDFATAYGGAQIDVDPNAKSTGLPQFQRFTFLSVFAIPALVDIALLTTTGRGLYLSAFMSFDQQNAATTALMISLLLSGATGTWIACGGSYYLISMAFSAMNVFVLTRLIAALAFTIAGGIIGFAVMSGIRGFTSGIIFMLYFIAFTIYLTLFAALASFQFPGSSFLSGRKLIIGCLPMLLITPIVTMWSGHDVVIYLAVFYIVIGMLLFSLRHIGSKWVTWYQAIKKTDDSEIRKWFTVNKAAGDVKVLGAMTDPAALKAAREALLHDVVAETKRGYFKKATQDQLVKNLAADWEATNFLLDWYCRYSDVPRPIPFSSSWNIQTKVALQTLVDAQKGIRLHSAFIHWRQAGDEVGCGILYFLVALLDKWVEMFSGVHLVGLSSSLNNQYRVAVGFGLAYYLIGAVLIDVKAQDLHEAVAKTKPVGIENTAELRQHQKEEVLARRSMYKKTLARYLLWHCWSLAFSASFVLLLSNSLNGMIMFLAYVGAYTGLLWYQYTKIFSGPHALKPMLTAVAVGLPVGLVLKKTMPKFHFSGVIALAVATWTAAILCLWTAKLGMPKRIEAVADTGENFHAHVKPWADPNWSQAELKALFDKTDSLPDDSRFVVRPHEHPGSEVITILDAYQSEGGLRKAFPDVDELVKIAVKAWKSGQIQIELVALAKLGSDIRAVSRWTAGSMKLFIGVSNGGRFTMDIRSNCRVIAELLLHEVAEGYFDIPHEHAVLAEQLVSDVIPQNMQNMLALETKHEEILSWGKREMLKQQCLGIECDLHWDQLPKSTREIFLNRALGDSCGVSDTDYNWLSTALNLSSQEDFDVHIARCDLALEAVATALDHAFSDDSEKYSEPMFDFDFQEIKLSTVVHYIKKPFSYIYHHSGIIVKFFVIAMVADIEFQREFEFALKDKPAAFRVPCNFILNMVWMYAKFVQDICLSFFVFHGRENVQKLWEESTGMTITQKRRRWVIRSIDGDTTAFKEHNPQGGFNLKHYQGIHKTEPKQDRQLLKFVCLYSNTGSLLSKEEYSKGEVTNVYEYDYDSMSGSRSFFKRSGPTVPEQRRCIRGPKFMENLVYNEKGLVESGSYMVDGNLVYFKFYYRKNAEQSSELLRGEFTMAHLSASVSWCAPPRQHPERSSRWIPHTKVLAAAFTEGPNVYVSKWSYDHKFHPKIRTTLNDEPIDTPPMIEHDWLGVLKKPSYSSFHAENPLIYFSFWNSNFIARWLGLSTLRTRVTTSVARSRVWKAWKKSNSLDGVIVRFMDEQLLRRDRVLRPYWRYRGRGDLDTAKKYLTARADAITASVDLDEEISSWTPLAFKVTDFLSFGSGGDAILHTKSQKVGYDTDDTLHVLAADNGTWPNEGGGVSACRRDMINSVKSVRWHMLCESANDFGIPKHQTEKNVLSLKVIPLWGLDFLTPTHGLFKNRLDTEVDIVRTDATDLDIKREFIPILTALVKGSRAIHLSSADIKQATRALIKLNDYFTDKRHWSQVWTSDVSKDAWRQLWLAQDMPNAKPASEWFDTELPTLGHLDTAMELWLRYLFVFAIRVPEKVPAVFQASHHSVSAAYGIICKIKRNCQLQIWDHAIAWRETNMCLSSTLCKLPPFVRNSMLGLMRLTSVMILHHADVILPCADFFNPGWEVEIGTCQGTLEHRNSFKRKIAPVVNGITDAEKFKPVKEILTKQPTVTMLSHLWFCKDLKTAILAADIIVNEWGFKDYQLDVYGSIEKAPIYSNECQELIASKALRGQVKLCGSADPLKVLEQTWLFLNSSLSEGLPLALGEAALTGAPVVCTDVGASLRVLSDPDDFSRYSAVVAPNDARALARAQIKMLGMLDEFAQYAEDDTDTNSNSPTVLPFAPTAQDVEAITARMYAKAEHRRSLGMRSREIVQKSFGGERYIREHEQMLWIGKSHKIMQTRLYGEEEIADEQDPSEIRHKLCLAAPIVDDEVIPRSVAPSWRSASPRNSFYSVRSRPITPGAAMQDARLSSRRLSEAMRSTSRLSQASTMSAYSGSGYSTPSRSKLLNHNTIASGNPSTNGTGFGGYVHIHGEAQLTALPGLAHDTSSPNSPSALPSPCPSPLKRPALGVQRVSFGPGPGYGSNRTSKELYLDPMYNQHAGDLSGSGSTSGRNTHGAGSFYGLSGNSNNSSRENVSDQQSSIMYGGHGGSTGSAGSSGSTGVIPLLKPPPTKKTKKNKKRPEMRYRNSDVSVIKLEGVGRWLTPMS